MAGVNFIQIRGRAELSTFFTHETSHKWKGGGKNVNVNFFSCKNSVVVLYIDRVYRQFT